MLIQMLASTLTMKTRSIYHKVYDRPAPTMSISWKFVQNYDLYRGFLHICYEQNLKLYILGIVHAILCSAQMNFSVWAKSEGNCINAQYNICPLQFCTELNPWTTLYNIFVPSVSFSKRTKVTLTEFWWQIQIWQPHKPSKRKKHGIYVQYIICT